MVNNQGGRSGTTTTTSDVTFPIAFPTKIFNAVPYDESNSADQAVALCVVGYLTLTKFTAGAKTVPSGFAWIAFGY